MDHHTDYTVKLITETKHSSLYEWCLQELDAEGEQVGRDLIPWGWSLDFDVTNLEYAFSLKHEDAGRYRPVEDDKAERNERPPITVQTSEYVYANLLPSEGRYRRTSYSMAGTDREITDIHLRIDKAEADNCNIWGSVSYTCEVDFRNETIGDFIDIHLQLTPEKFDDIARMINSGAIDGGTLSLSCVRGFYSDWSPEISTDFVKVLTPSIDAQKVEIPEDAEIVPPRLGAVGEFQLRLNKNHQLMSADKDTPPDWMWIKKQTEANVRSVSVDQDGEDDEDRPTYVMNEERASALRRTRKYELLTEMYRELYRYSVDTKLGSDVINDISNLA